MKRFLCSFAVLLSMSLPGWAVLQVEVLDYSRREVRLIYEFMDDMVANAEFRFPGSGFIHDSSYGPIIVEHVYDLTRNQPLTYKVQNLPDNVPQLVITYPQPLGKGEEKRIQVQVIVHLPPANISRDTYGRYTFRYTTDHRCTFIVAPNHYVVQTNQAVIVTERDGRIHLEQANEDRKEIEIITRAR
ncbi:MAG: hypothetical protein ACOX5R_04585 [bacterium]|jgi:hypothetical protein